MTAEEEFEKWWASQMSGYMILPSEGVKSAAKAAYLAATKATAARCVEICYDQSHDDTKRGRLQAQSVLTRCAAVIKKEFDFE